MPTVARFAGFRVAISPNDHRPAHVHVIGHGVESVFEMNCPDGASSFERTTAQAESKSRKCVAR